MYAKRMSDPMAKSDSSLTTYNSDEIAAAVRPEPRTTEPVFETTELPGRLSMMEEAFSAGAGFWEYWRAPTAALIGC